MHTSKVSAVLSLLLASKASYASPTRHGNPHIEWGTCDPSVVNDTSLSCGFLNVPLDYDDPYAGTARLALIKANATGKRQGSVFFNPGGPGFTGLGAVNGNKDLLLGLSGGVYDVVSWDPRGVGLTTPGDIACFDSLEEYDALFNGTVELTGIEELGNFTNPADIDALLAQAPLMQKKYEQLGQKCLRSANGKFLKYLGTAATVRDMVSIANALDGPDVPINYFGISYGTILGSWFVNMFPERVGRVILDGVVDPINFALNEPALTLASYLVSDDMIYKGLITGCALAGPAGCAAASEGDGPLDIDAKFQALLKKAYGATKLNSSVPITSGQLRNALFLDLDSPSDWSKLVNEGYPETVEIIDGEARATRNTSVTERSQKSTYRSPHFGPGQVASDAPSFTADAIFCGDTVDPRGTTMEQVFKSVIATAQNTSHTFGASWPLTFYRCSFWPVRAVERYQGPFNKKLANKVIVANNLFDPLTPLPSAERLASALGEDAVLVRQNAFGHTTLSAPSACTDQIFIDYMVNGTLPTNDTLCEVDADFELFPNVTTADILAHIPGNDV